MSVAASIQDRYGTESQENEDKGVVQTLWKFSPKSYDNEKIVVLPYAHYIGVAAVPGVSAIQQYNINSTYDPDLTGAGNQPLGRDTWAGIYDYYKVLETHIKVTITLVNDDSTGGVTSSQLPSQVGWMADITANPPASANVWLMTALAAKNNKQQRFGPINNVDIVNGRGSKTRVLEYHWDASQFDTSTIDNAKNEWTAVGSNPANNNYFSVISNNPQGVGSRQYAIHTEILYLTAFKVINRTLLNTVN